MLICQCRQPGAETIAQPVLALCGIAGQLVRVTVVEGEPLVELRLVTVEHVDQRIEHGFDVDGHCRREWIGPHELVRHVGDHRIFPERRHLRADRRHSHHVRGIAHQLRRVAMVGVIVVGAVGDNQVRPFLADQGDEPVAGLERRQQGAVRKIEDVIANAQHAPRSGRFAAADLDQSLAIDLVVAGFAVCDTDEAHLRAVPAPQCCRPADLDVAIVRVRPDDQNSKCRIRHAETRVFG
jgi:hypothetical protein